MTDIEVLLSVDRGKIPAGAFAFFLEGDDASQRRARAALAALTGAATVACAAVGGGRFLIALMGLAAAGLAVLAWPTAPEAADDAVIKRQVVVITAGGIMVRDDGGLRSWQFANLSAVQIQVLDQRPLLVLIEQNGNRHTVDHSRFGRATRLRELVDERVRLRHSLAG